MDFLGLEKGGGGDAHVVMAYDTLVSINKLLMAMGSNKQPGTERDLAELLEALAYAYRDGDTSISFPSGAEVSITVEKEEQ